MINTFIKKSCVVIKFIPAVGLFVILATVFVSSFFYETQERRVFVGISMLIVYGMFSTYRIALKGIRRLLTPSKLNVIILNGLLVIIQTLFLSLTQDFRGVKFIIGFLGNTYVLYVMGVTIRSIGLDLVSLEKKRVAKLDEYIGLSFALLLYIFAIPTLHTRIQNIVIANESKIDSPLENQRKNSNPFFIQKEDDFS